LIGTGFISSFFWNVGANCIYLRAFLPDETDSTGLGVTADSTPILDIVEKVHT
jgi:hypothetical protein